MFEAKLLLRAGLIRTVKVHEYLISLHSSYEPALNGSSALQCFERGNVVEIRIGIMFDFYLRLPHLEVHSDSRLDVCCNDSPSF